MICKKFLRLAQKSREPRGPQMVSTVEQAQDWLGFLLRQESRGPGDTDNAMARLARRTGLPRSTLWALRYRPPKDVLASVYLTLRGAYEAEHERQIARLHHDLTAARQAGRADAALVRAAAALAGASLEGVAP